MVLEARQIGFESGLILYFDPSQGLLGVNREAELSTLHIASPNFGLLAPSSAHENTDSFQPTELEANLLSQRQLWKCPQDDAAGNRLYRLSRRKQLSRD